MTTSAIAKLLLSRSQASCRSLPKPCIYALSSIARHHQLSSRNFPSLFRPPVNQSRKPSLYHATSNNRQSNPSQQEDSKHKKGLSKLWADIKAIKSSPLPVLVLGFSSLVPFVAPPVYMIMTQTFISKLAFIQNTYGACMLSFFGGVQWGFAIPSGSPLKANLKNFGQSIFACMVAWMSLMMPPTAATLTIMVGVAGATYLDSTCKGYPPWYRGMRYAVSFWVFLALWTALLCKAMLTPHTDGQLVASKVNKFGGSLCVRAAENEDHEITVAKENTSKTENQS